MLFDHSWSASAVRGAESLTSREESRGLQPLERHEDKEALCGGLLTRLETSAVTQVRNTFKSKFFIIQTTILLTRTSHKGARSCNFQLHGSLFNCVSKLFYSDLK